ESKTHRCTNVPVVLGDLPCPALLVRPMAQMRIRALHERGEEVRMSQASRRRLAATFELLSRELADRLQHPISAAARDLTPSDQALVDERLHRVDVGVADRFDRFVPTAVDKHG